MATAKIVVFGSLNGQFASAFKKLATLQAKNNFSLAILTGDVFGEPDDESVDTLLEGKIEIPLPTYFTIGTKPLPPVIQTKVEADEEICPNLHFLGKCSTTNTSEGVRIVTLGGQLDQNIVAGESQEKHLPFHSTGDAKKLRGANSADILLTSIWPSGVWTGSNRSLEPSNQASIKSSEDISNLCAALKPRYHFTASPGGFFYEREPFVHPSETESGAPSATRFISMAPYGNEAKAKAMYAFTLNKSESAIPTDATATPFAAKARKRPADSEGYSRFDNHDHSHHDRRRKKRRNHSPPPGPDRCYFCLSNPNISAHMCCSIGDDAYITTAKGPLTTSTTFSDVGIDYPAHLIIIPLSHSPTIPSMGSVSDPESEAVKAYKEMTRFREALQASIASQSSHRLGLVTWEISRGRNVHLIWQLLPLPIDMMRKGIAEAAFRVEAENQKLPSFTARDLTLEEQVTFGDFFRVWLWADDGEDKIKGKSLVMPLEQDTRFDLQFGRRVCAKLLGLEKRLIWQDCAQTEEEETENVERFREAFKEWDFTLQES